MPKRVEAEPHPRIRSPFFLVTSVLAIGVPTSLIIANTLLAVKSTKLLSIVAEQEEEALPLCRQVPKYRRLSGAAERNQKERRNFMVPLQPPI